MAKAKIAAGLRATTFVLAAMSLGAMQAGAQSLRPTPALTRSNVRISVRDAQHRPVSSADVCAKEPGGDVVVGHTDTSGTATISAAPGDLIFVRLNGTSTQPEAVSGSSLEFSIGLKTIARVVAHNSAGSNVTSAQSVAAIISGNVGDALAFVPNYRSQAEGGSGAMELNGTPLTLPTGTDAARFAFPSDLLSSFSASQADDGSIMPNLHLENPTALPQQQFSFSTGSQDQGGVKAAATGPGYAFVLSDRSNQGVLAGRDFADASGISYDHSMESHQMASSADLEFRLGGAQASAAGFASDTRNAQISAVDPGRIVEGPGPGNWETTRLADGYLRAAQSRGRDQWAALHVQYAGAGIDDDLNAFAGLLPIPSDSGFRYSGRYDELSLTRTFAASSATLKASSAGNLSEAFDDPYESVSASSATTLTLLTQHANLHSSFNTKLESTRETGAFPAAHINASVGGTLSSNDSQLRWSLYSSLAQTLLTDYAASLRLSEPGSADFSCGGHAAFASGPSDVAPSAPRSVGVTVNEVRHVGAHTQLSAGGFVSRTRDALVDVSENNSLALSPAYVATLGAQYAYLCGGRPLTASDVYLERYVSVPQRVDREWYLSGTTSLGPFALTAAYETYSSVAFGVSGTAGVDSTLINGAQTWNIPLHRASTIFSYHAGPVTAGIGAVYVSANNSAHLPGHVITSAGLRWTMRSGILSLSAQNLFRRDAGDFASTALGTPAAMSGPPVTFLATPIAPTWSLRYGIRTSGRRLLP